MKHIITEKHFFKYLKCPSWVYFDVHGDVEKALHPLLEKLAHGGLVSELERKLIEDRVDIREVKRDDLDEASIQTLELMRQGVQTIYKGVLIDGRYVAQPDLLEKVQGKSKLGDYYYIACDIKGNRHLYDVHKFQGSFYAELLLRVQGVRPLQGYIMTPDAQILAFSIEEFESQFNLTLFEIEKIISGEKPPEFPTSGCKQSPWYPQCVKQAEECDDISLINRIHKAEVASLNSAGIFTVSDLKAIDPFEISGKTKIDADRAGHLQKQAIAMSEKRHIHIADTAFPKSNTELYFDVEADPLRDAYYLFGVLEVSDGKKQYHAFVAEHPDQEKQAWDQFVEFMNERPAAPVYHWGSYERGVLATMSSRHGAPNGFCERVIGNMIDMLDVAREATVFPTYFFSLKDIAQYIGFAWRSADASGTNSVLWYEDWLGNQDRAVLNKIIEYNEDDVVATHFVKIWIESKK
ncbi:MAG: hypothetical protein ACD_76C00151G0001 [uncultured bacterium]|nr:MAG: hypothetical protein ACD_76C00151G0001 [uncultured bacterium]HBD04883.1 hypothetical protein [Candidatus Uhrbacteria bacterium]